MDPVLQDMIRAAGNTAALLARVTRCPSSPERTHRPQKSLLGVLETQCRHIDYVITGRFRSSRSFLNGSDLDCNRFHRH
jgi:hypothetical protein